MEGMQTLPVSELFSRRLFEATMIIVFFYPREQSESLSRGFEILREIPRAPYIWIINHRIESVKSVMRASVIPIN